MRWFLWMTFLCVLGSAGARAETVLRIVEVTSAQQDAERMARTGGPLRHCGTAGGRREGIGFSTVSADAAVRSCCFYADAMRGRYRIVERGVARGPRGWYAVLRFE
jgi:hypothetical protein